MVNIKLVPTWVWIAAPALVLAWVMVQQSVQASYYRGIAEDAEYRIELQEIVLDSVVLRSDSLSVVLQEADSAIEAERLANEREVARLTRSREEVRERTEEISERLMASLDSVQAVELDSIVIGYELILSLREGIGGHQFKDFIQAAEIAALRGSMRPSLGLRLKADWWLAAIGLAGGYVLWGTK